MQTNVLLQKMRTSLNDGRAQYWLSTNDGEVFMNELLDKQISIRFSDKIECVCCGKTIKKTFFNGFCYNCFTVAPEAEDCILNPEKCRAHEGIARNMEYATAHCLSPHVVYVASSGGVKVGVTRCSQIPTRWIDQGAVRALPIAQTPNRFLAGSIEVALKKHLPDKSNWRKLITGELVVDDLLPIRDFVASVLPEKFHQYLLPDEKILQIEYPILGYLPKAVSLNLDKAPQIEGRLIGIRGQYLLIDGCGAINIRSHTGYWVDFDFV